MNRDEYDCKQISMSLPALSKIVKSNTNNIPETPFFFTIYCSTDDITYNFATSQETDRTRWIKGFKNATVNYFLLLYSSIILKLLLFHRNLLKKMKMRGFELDFW